ncbi:replication factor A protein 3-like protein [Roseobacter weihaiensis]|uniref:replication factor A protein 3-like protein n=1 Tax=Roseobacter weihaiensis TaxID=2763262 RepID=UPI001D0B9DCC|nr:replication factor A protein 3-like protein [Roseobacter sp. H9]
MSVDPPLVALSDLAKYVGDVVRVSGTYKAEFNPAHKMLVTDEHGNTVPAGCVVLLAVEDGAVVDLFDRPVDEGRRLNGQRVMVTGKLVAPLAAEDSAVAMRTPLYGFVDISAIAPVEG